MAATDALISGGLPIVGDILGGLFTWYGMEEQAEENQKTRDANERLYNKSARAEESQFSRNLALNREQLKEAKTAGAYNRDMTTKNFNWQKKQTELQTTINNMMRMVSFFNGQPQIAASLSQMYRQ